MKLMKMKRIVTFLLAVVMVIGLLPGVTLFQADAAKGDITTEHIGTLDTGKSVSLPITVHNYPNDGMLFEYSGYSGTETLYAREYPAAPDYYYGNAGVLNGSGSYLILSYANSQFGVATTTTSNVSSGDNVHLYATSRSSGNNHKWRITDQGNGTYTIVNLANTALVLDTQSDSPTSGTNVELDNVTSSKSMYWYIEPNSDGSYTIRNVANAGVVLDISGGTISNGTNIQSWEDNDSTAQKWLIVPLDETPSAAGAVISGQRFTGSQTQLAVQQTHNTKDTRYLSLVYHVDNTAMDNQYIRIHSKLNETFTIDSWGSTAAENVQIMLYNYTESSDTFFKLERAGNELYRLRVCIWNGSTMTDSPYYVGCGNTRVSRTTTKNITDAALWMPVQHSDDNGSWAFVLASKDSTTGETLCLDVPNGAAENGNQLWAYYWNDNPSERFWLRDMNNNQLDWGSKNVTLELGLDTGTASKTLTLSAAPGYHRLVVDLNTVEGFDAAKLLKSISLNPNGNNVSLSAITCFEKEADAVNFGTQSLAYLSGAVKLDGTNVTRSWRATTEADYNAHSNEVRKYKSGNNLAFGMLLPNSTAGAGNYYKFDNFGYASPWGTDTTVQNNLSAGKWAAYAVSHYGYQVPQSEPYGAWFVTASQGLPSNDVTTTSTGRPMIQLPEKNNAWYNDISKFLPNMRSYIRGMATVGLVEYTLDPVTKEPVYTQDTTQKLGQLLAQALKISEQNDDGTYNYNYVQGAKVYNDKGEYVGRGGTHDFAALIRNYLRNNISAATTDNWPGYVAGHTDLLKLSLPELLSEPRGNCCNTLDIAYWMLNTLYKNKNGVSEVVPEYDHLILTQETNTSGKSYYVFDGGYANTAYDVENGAIYNYGTSSDKDSYQFGSESNQMTTMYAFLPTKYSTVHGYTDSPYFKDDGVETRLESQRDGYINRDFNFSMEGHGQFTYSVDQNQYFNFEGDDDVYLFINNKMVMDIGGAHSITLSHFNLNDYKDILGLEDGEVYDFDFFYMERHGYGSNIRIETNIEVTSKDVVPAKGAIQNGAEVSDYGLVKQNEILEYHFTLSNTGYVLPLTNLSFRDGDIGFAAGYDGVTLGSYTLNNTIYDRTLSEIYAVLKTEDGRSLTLNFATTDALQSFLTDVVCEGHPEKGLKKGESLTIYGVRYAYGSDGLHENTVYTEASSITGLARFHVLVGNSQTYYQWAGHPIATSISDAVGTVLTDAQIGTLSGWQPCTPTGTTSDSRLVADGVYTFGFYKPELGETRNLVWGVTDGGDQIVLKNHHAESVKHFFYVKYQGGGYYSIQYLQNDQYVYIDIASGTNKDPGSDNSLADYDDRLKLKTVDGAIPDEALWTFTATDGGYQIHPKLNSGFAVDDDGGKTDVNTVIHLWTNPSTNTTWHLNAHSGGNSDMTTLNKNIVVFNYDQAGAYTQYFKATFTDGGNTASAVVPVTIYALDVADDTYVLDYGLPVNLNDANDGGFTLNDTLAVGSAGVQTKLERLVTSASYPGLKQIAQAGCINTASNGLSVTTATRINGTYGSFEVTDGVRTEAGQRPTYYITSAKDSNYVLSLNNTGTGDWSDTKPSGYDDSQVETRTVYRYADYETTTSNATSLEGYERIGEEWQVTSTGYQDRVDFPSTVDGNNSIVQTYKKNALTADESSTNKRTIDSTSTVGYVLWHWCWGRTNIGGPYRRYIAPRRRTDVTDNEGYQLTTFHAWISTSPASALGAELYTPTDTSVYETAYWYFANAVSASSPHCKDTYNWYQHPIIRQNYTDYQKLFTYGRYGAWSEWSTTAVTSSSTRKVQTKTQYRLKSEAVSEENLPAAIQVKDTSNPSQLWHINEYTQDGASFVTLENANSGMVLYVDFSTTYPYVKQHAKSETPQDSEKFRLGTDSNGNTTFTSVADTQSRVLEINDGSSLHENQAVGLWSNSDNCLWRSWTLVDTASDEAKEMVDLVYTPSAIMNGADSAKVLFRACENGKTPTNVFGQVDIHKEVEMYETVKTVPASVVYYEDNFPGLNYSTENNGNTITPGGGDGDYQDANQNEQYGHDSNYEDEGAEISGGSLTTIKITASKTVMSFNFKGTGFEVISRCTAADNATIAAKVYDSSKNLIKNIPVILEYDNNGDGQGSEKVYQVPVISVTGMTPGAYTVELSAVATADYSKYDVSLLEYDTVNKKIYYLVTSKTDANEVYVRVLDLNDNSEKFIKGDDKNGTDYYNGNPLIMPSYLYIDGIRIFNPFETNADDWKNDYLATEAGASILQIHDQVLAGNMWVGSATSTDHSLGSASTYLENRNGNLFSGNSSSIDEYALVGPNNELYLDGLSSNQALVFYVTPDSSVAAEERTLQIGARVIDAAAIGGFVTSNPDNSTGVDISLSQSTSGGGWMELCSGMTSGAEQYYVIRPEFSASDGENGYLVVLKPENGILSVTGLKVKGYSLTKAFTASEIKFGDNGMLDDASIEKANGMIDKFKEIMNGSKRMVISVINGKETLVELNPTPIEPVEPAAELAFDYASLTLKSNFALNFYVSGKTLEGYENPHVVFNKSLYDADGNVVGNQEITVTDYTTRTDENGNVSYIFSFNNISAAEMGSEVKATLLAEKNGQLCSSEEISYSVLQYASNMLNNTDRAELKTLLVDMLNYGADAQTYFGYNTANLVNADLTEEQKSFATQTDPAVESVTKVTKNDGAQIGFRSASLMLEERVTINYYLDLSGYTGDLSELYLKVTFVDANGEEQTAVIDGSEFVVNEKGCCANFSGLNPAQLRTACVAEVFTKANDQRISHTLTYSVESYAAQKAQDENATLTALLRSMMKYGDATAAYFAN